MAIDANFQEAAGTEHATKPFDSRKHVLITSGISHGAGDRKFCPAPPFRKNKTCECGGFPRLVGDFPQYWLFSANGVVAPKTTL